MELLDNSLIRIIFMVLGGLFVLVLIAAMPSGVLRFIGRLALNCVMGLAVLTLINCFASFTGFALPLNALTVAVSGICGIPGVVALSIIAAI